MKPVSKVQSEEGWSKLGTYRSKPVFEVWSDKRIAYSYTKNIALTCILTGDWETRLDIINIIIK